jgi:hypothetical protein
MSLVEDGIHEWEKLRIEIDRKTEDRYVDAGLRRGLGRTLVQQSLDISFTVGFLRSSLSFSPFDSSREFFSMR